MLLCLLLFVFVIHTGVTTSNNLQTCKNTKVEENVTLRGGIGAGTFKKLAKVTSMASCVELCCKNPSCDVAFMSGLKCYAVECVSDDECESTATDTSETKVLIAHVRNGKNKETKIFLGTLDTTISKTLVTKEDTVATGSKSFTLAGIPKHNTLASKSSIPGSSSSSKSKAKGTVSSGKQTPNRSSTSPQSAASGKQTMKNSKAIININPGMAGQCKPGKVHKEVTLKGGINAGTYKDIGHVSSVDECTKKCCSFAPCDLAFVLQDRCYLVACTDGKNCQLQKAKSSPYHPSVVYVTRWNNEGVKHTVIINDDTSSSFMCSPMKLMTKVTLKGGLKAGAFTDTGKVGNIGECYDLCCKQPSCNLAFMLGQNCFSVKCYNKDLCSTIPAQPSIYNPQIAYVWNRKEVPPKEDSSKKKSEITKPAPACPKAKVMNEVTLIGGLGAGHFHDNGKVKDMQQCRRICCEMPKCHLAFMLGINCFSVECKNAALCKTQKARPSQFSPRISFVRAFGSTKFMTPDEAQLAVKPIEPPVSPATNRGSFAKQDKPIQKPKSTTPSQPGSPILPGSAPTGIAGNPQTPVNPKLAANPPGSRIPGLPAQALGPVPGLKKSQTEPLLLGTAPGLKIPQAEPAQSKNLLLQLGSASHLNKPLQAEPLQNPNLIPQPEQPHISQLPQGRLQGQPLIPQPSQGPEPILGKPSLDIKGMPNSIVPQQTSVPKAPIMPSPAGLPNQLPPSQALGLMSPQSETPMQQGQGISLPNSPESTAKKTDVVGKPASKGGPSQDLLQSVNLTNTITDAKPGQAMKMNIVDGKLQLTPLGSSKGHKPGIDESKTNTSGSSTGAFDTILGDGENKDNNKCMAAKVITDVTLKGGKKAGKFKDHGDVMNMKACKKLCCDDDSCNLSFMLEKTCYTVTCKNRDLCDHTPAPPSDFRPRISYVRPLKDTFQEMADLPAIPQDPSNLRCQHSNITNDKIFEGEINTSNYTLQKDATDMPKCMARCCESKKCNIAYYVDNKCYSVSCTPKEACKPVSVKGKPKNKIPLISAMLTKPKEEEEEVTDLAADVTSPKSSVSEVVTNLPTTKERCRSNRISTGITLRNGNGGSNFTAMGQVESLKKCIALCCVRPSCDIAYLENNKCFAVHCNDGVMCQTNAHEADMDMNVKLAYMERNSGPVKERDWMIVYIIVGSLAFAAVIGGVIWGICICTKRNKIVKQRRLLDDEDDEDDEMLPKPTQTRYRTPMHRY